MYYVKYPYYSNDPWDHGWQYCYVYGFDFDPFGIDVHTAKSKDTASLFPYAVAEWICSQTKNDNPEMEFSGFDEIVRRIEVSHDIEFDTSLCAVIVGGVIVGDACKVGDLYTFYPYDEDCSFSSLISLESAVKQYFIFLEDESHV